MLTLSGARTIALQVAADAAFQEGVELDESQLAALEDASPYALASAEELDEIVSASADCRNWDTNDWYPLVSENPDTRVRLADERRLAADLCEFCPVSGACLALSYRLSEKAGKPGAHGVWGRLGARDRKMLRPLWNEVQRRVTEAEAVAS